MRHWTLRLITMLFLNAAASQLLAADTASLKFWNTTAETITELYLAPAGTSAWSANLCLTDQDHAVDPDERLSLPGITGGSYEVRVVDKRGRKCLFHDLRLSGAGHYAFALSEEQMASCH
jgi:hypothetical protein